MFTLTIYRDNQPTLRITRTNHRAAVDAFLRTWMHREPLRFTISDPDGNLLASGTEGGFVNVAQPAPRAIW